METTETETGDPPSQPEGDGIRQGHVTCCRTRRLTRAETDGPGDASMSEGAGGGLDDRDEVSEEKHSPQKAVAASGHVHHPDSSS
ncbi:unnamed protein product [Gadus morhua 'NCC']